MFNELLKFYPVQAIWVLINQSSYMDNQDREPGDTLI